MGSEIYAPLIEDMTWSYSRIKSFDDCPYGWFLRYIRGEEEEDMFYASFGSFMHELLAGFYRGELTREQMKIKYTFDFQTEVKGTRPSSSIAVSYFEKGLDFIKNFEPLPLEILGVEREFNCNIAGLKFRGFIDLIGRDKDGIVIVDHKSRDLKPRSKRKKTTQSDAELDKMLTQLYIYSAAVEQEYGETPVRLIFNCFKSQTVIEEAFRTEAYKKALKWAKNTVERIKASTEFYPQYDFFPCRNLCGLNGSCCYYEIMQRK